MMEAVHDDTSSGDKRKEKEELMQDSVDADANKEM